jgi:hypothetical protein
MPTTTERRHNVTPFLFMINLYLVFQMFNGNPRILKLL